VPIVVLSAVLSEVAVTVKKNFFIVCTENRILGSICQGRFYFFSHIFSSPKRGVPSHISAFIAWMTSCLAALSGQAPKPEGSRRLRREGLTAKARAEHNHFAMMPRGGLPSD